MLMTPSEFAMLKPLYACAEANPAQEVSMRFNQPGGRQLTLTVSGNTLLVQARYPDSPPAVEFYRTPQGCAQAYGVPLRRILNLNEGD